jgi:N-acetylglutamate synthase-like GNAT family acetyltransferase
VLAPALYDGDQLAAFVFGVPRRVRFGGAERHLALLTFFSVAPAWKGHGLGAEVWAECLRQARTAGYDGAIHFCVDGNVSNHVTLAGARRAGLTATPIPPVRFLVRLLTPGAESTAWASDVDDFLRAAASAAPEAPLVRLWSRAEAEWQCRDRVAPVCVTHSTGGGVGAVAGYCMELRDARRTRCVFIDDILWDQLAPDDRPRLLQQFLAAAASQASVAVVPLLGYTDVEAFRAAGFRRSPKVLNAYLTTWGATPALDVSAMYIDVF